ncbi:hypothetical protein CPT03_07305 [Pedobacter ginsengisoli]|uniref:Uncharacterized protein n=1 Tax=Pedobacter ginsengisoli TaxID=363852 RepID=A0A2D1U3W1_9SPHI|nr:hypothetical protein [Pedobacter ginsengisoli]ATP56292.1 hypothetical protein CPT03_07305 [Pedobacter ginsengisoli]
MNFEESTNVIYVTPDGDQVFTFIREVNYDKSLYLLDFNDLQVTETELKLNTHPNFSNPHGMNKDHIIAYHYDRLINSIVKFIAENHSEEHLKIYRDLDTIYFETVFHTPKTLEEKKLFKEVVDKFNKIIGEVNSMIKSRFNKQIEVILKFPSNSHHLHSVRI